MARSEEVNKKNVRIRLEPELRHTLAHLVYAVECLASNCPLGAKDNLKSIEGTLMFEGESHQEWERYFEAVFKSGSKRYGGAVQGMSSNETAKAKGKLFEDMIIIKMEPELRHVLSHLYYAIDCLIQQCPAGAEDNLKCIEGLIKFSGEGPENWEAQLNPPQAVTLK